MKDITDWSVINKLDNDFVKQFKFVHIFNSGNSVIIITNDDCVYVCGNNDNGCLGLGHTDSVQVPTKLEQLCHKQIINITGSGFDFLNTKYGHMMYALTSNGVLYHWGFIKIGSVDCNGDICVKPAVIESLSGKFIVDINCCYGDWLALTMNGEVYQWGLVGYDRTICYPKLVFGLKLHTITAISCGHYHSLALSDNGEVFSWGHNFWCQLGCGTGYNHKEAIKVEGLGDNKVTKISCGLNHNLVLTESGDIYVFGANNCGQLGVNSKDDKSIATKVTNTSKFVDISTLGYQSNLSIGLSRDGYCYVWGRVGKNDVMIPTKSEFKNIDEVLQNYSEKRITYKALYFKKKFNNLSVYERLEESFDKQEFCDIKFKIGDKEIYAQKAHLKAVCHHFNAMFSDNVVLQSNAKEMEIKDYSYSVYYSFLKYLYTDSLNIQSKHLIELYNLAHSYNEDVLKQKCIEMMKKSTNVNNVYTFFSFAGEINFDDLKKYFYDYMTTYLSEFFDIQSFAQPEGNFNLKELFKNTRFNSH